MSPLATEIIGTIALLAGLLALWVKLVATLIFLQNNQHSDENTLRLIALCGLTVVLFVMIITNVGRVLDWLVS